MKIDGVLMPNMTVSVRYFNKEKEEDNANGDVLTDIIALGKRYLTFSAKGMTRAKMAILMTAIKGKSIVTISEYDDPQLNGYGSGIFKVTSPTGTALITNSGVVISWSSVGFTATEQ